MKKLYSLLVVASVTASTALAQTNTLQTKIAPSGPEATTANVTLSRADDVIYTDWATAPGNWEYVSNYTNKRYPTKVQKRVGQSAAGEIISTEFKIQNTLYGEALLTFNSSTSMVSLKNLNNGYTEILNPDGTGTGEYVYSSTSGPNLQPGSYLQYPASENIRLALRRINAKEEMLGAILYDYLYNTDATPCQVDVELPFLVENPITLTGKVGKGATDLYYILAIKSRNEDEAGKLSPDIAEQYGFPVNYSTFPSILNDYIATGKMNSAVKIGKITPDASGNFTIAVPENWEGQRAFAVIALKDGAVCDQKYQRIEMRRNIGWKPYKELGISFDMTPIINMQEVANLWDLPSSIATQKMVAIEINEEAKLLRIPNPYNGTPSQRNYIYVDYSQGLDKCYISASYSPYTQGYKYHDRDFAEKSAKLPLSLGSVASTNVFSGISLDFLSKNSDAYFFNLNSFPEVKLFIQTESQQFMSPGIYAAAFGALKISTPTGVNFQIDTDYSVQIKLGNEIERLEFAFINQENPATTSQTYTITNTGAESYDFDLISKIIAKEIPATANAVKYTAYYKAGGAQEPVVVPVAVDLNVDFAKVDFASEIDFNTSGRRPCRLSAKDGNPCVSILNFNKSFYYNNESDNTLQILFTDGTPTIEKAFFGNLSFSNSGLCEVYIEAENTLRNANTITTDFLWNAYSNTNEFLFTYQTSACTIVLPASYDLDSGINAVVTEQDASVAAEYFNLQGQRVKHPVAGTMYIERKGTTVRKILF